MQREAVLPGLCSIYPQAFRFIGRAGRIANVLVGSSEEDLSECIQNTSLRISVQMQNQRYIFDIGGWWRTHREFEADSSEELETRLSSPMGPWATRGHVIPCRGKRIKGQQQLQPEAGLTHTVCRICWDKWRPTTTGSVPLSVSWQPVASAGGPGQRRQPTDGRVFA